MGDIPDHKFYRIVKVDEMPVGERLFFELDEQAIVLYSINGEFIATGDVCSHDQGPIGEGEIVGNEITCPRHGARFNILTGEVISLPAVIGIPVYPVRVIDGFIEVGITVG